MAESLQTRLTQLETLFAEQDYTVQVLNDMVAQQDQEISRLNMALEMIQQQLRDLKSELSGNIDPGIEKPPHY